MGNNKNGTPKNLIKGQLIEDEPTVDKICTRYHRREFEFLQKMSSGDRQQFIRAAVRKAIALFEATRRRDEVRSGAIEVIDEDEAIDHILEPGN